MYEWDIRSLPTSKCPHPCVYLDSNGVCNYYLMTDIRRPCPPGPDCIVHDPGGDEKRVAESVVASTKMRFRKVSWDTEKAKDMHDAGASYKEIAKAVGVHWKTVEDYARKFWGDRQFFKE